MSSIRRMGWSVGCVVLVAACGGADQSTYGVSPSGSDSSGSERGSAFDPAGTSTTAGDADPASIVDAQCAGTHAGLNGLPSHLVLVLDRSNSMNDAIAGSKESKWTQALAALGAFFSSPQSEGITLDLIPFPSSEDKAFSCNPAEYQSVPPGFTAKLPDADQTLGKTLTALPRMSGTPTRPALDGAIAYAKGLEKSLAGKANVALILATDGEPTGCAPNKIADVSGVVGAIKDSLKTYVIGLGDSLDNLNAIASAAGTNGGKAFLVTSASASVTEDLTKALGSIRSAALTCNYEIPTPPEGKVLDVGQVNVVIESGGKQSLVKHSPDCSNAEGWRYDNERAPTRILLCDGACGTVKSPATTSIDVVLGCATKGSEPVN